VVIYQEDFLFWLLLVHHLHHQISWQLFKQVIFLFCLLFFSSFLPSFFSFYYVSFFYSGAFSVKVGTGNEVLGTLALPKNSTKAGLPTTTSNHL